MSKQVPLLLLAEVRNPEDENQDPTGSAVEVDKEKEIIKIMFKHGDDLR